MDVDVVPPADLSEALLERWRELHGADPALHSPYLRPELTLAAGAVRDDVRVGVASEGGRVVGFFPFQRPLPGVARPVAGPLDDCQAFVCAPEARWRAHELLRGCGIRVWRFDHLVASQRPFAPYHVRVLDSPAIDLRAGYEDYLASHRRAGSKRVASLRRKRRRLEDAVGPLRYERHVVDEEVFRTVLAWKSAQFVATGRLDPFRRPWTVDLLRRLLAERTPGFAGVLSVLWTGDGRPAAIHLGMRSATVWHYWFPSYDHALARHSPGLVLLLAMAEDAAAQGLTRIDLGKGDDRYKQEWANASGRVAEGSVMPAPLRLAAGAGQRAADWLRTTPLRRLARGPARAARRVRAWAGMR